MNQNESMITIDEVTKEFGTVVAVDRLSLDVHKGELFAFLGPNGAGKTTTIKMIVSLLKATAGVITIDGKNLEKQSLEVKKQISYIPDVPYVYDKLTAGEFMQFVCGIYGMNYTTETRQKIDKVLRLFGLAERKDTLIESFSHGLRQRLVFSAALVHDPELLVIDEPMVGLDPESARLVKDILREFTNEGKTVFMSTHTLSVAEELADRIGIINKGKLVALGTQSELDTLSGSKKRNLEEIFLTITSEQNV